MPTSESERQILLTFAFFRWVRQIIPTAHGIEQHVRKMTRIIGLIARFLHTIVPCYYTFQRLSRLSHRRLNHLYRIRLRNKMH